MKIGLNLSNDELKEMAERQNKSIEEVANDYKHALKELEYSNKKLGKIIKDFKYTKFPNDIRLHNYGKNTGLLPLFLKINCPSWPASPYTQLQK